jgi:hypothetical protein
LNDNGLKKYKWTKITLLNDNLLSN